MNENHARVLQIAEFIAKSTGLRSREDDGQLEILQTTDGKALVFPVVELEEVIARIDGDGVSFLQVNFTSGKKILLTQNLIGFKPAAARGLDLGKLPKVVTTPDLLSVVEAIEDSISSAPIQKDEIDVLKKVFDAVLKGAESVGFDTTSERVWLQSLERADHQATA